MTRSLVVALLLLAPVAVVAQSFDGTYAGTLSCPAFPGQAPLQADVTVTVAARTARYELKPGSVRGAGIDSHERGSGTVTPSGQIVLTGGCGGGFSCATDYRGNLGATPIRLEGSQRWWFRGGDRERACVIELTRATP